jgi:uncharacterized DUF497 family protein
VCPLRGPGVNPEAASVRPQGARPGILPGHIFAGAAFPQCTYFMYIAAMGERERTAWDDLKSETNLRLRGIGFAGLDDAFDGRFALLREDARRDYGEARFNMIVALNGVILNITFTPRDGKQRIISARLANRMERRLYDAGQQGF